MNIPKGTQADRGAPGGLSCPVILTAVATASFILLGVLVATDVTQHPDVAIRDSFLHHKQLGPPLDLVVEGLRPRNTALFLGAVGLASSLRLSSWRPAVYAATIGGATVVLTLAVKFLLQRPDPSDQMTAIGGSFPSGHTAMLIVSVGGAVLILHERSRLWEWVGVALAGLLMGLALMVQAAHWFTDVVGGVLLALALLSAASVWRLRRQPRRAERTVASRRR